MQALREEEEEAVVAKGANGCSRTKMMRKSAYKYKEG